MAITHGEAATFTEVEKIAALEKFNSLTSLDEKFSFWVNTIKEEYVYYAWLTSPINALLGTSKRSEYLFRFQEFEIKAKDSEEILEYNARIEEGYIRVFVPLNKKLHDVDKMIEQFESSLSAHKNKKEHINAEIKKVAELVSTKK